ncbi:hypothetical protein BASA61_005646 [Batrachochytrium salamandrivorans]|nr:hypothetical protein BASA61_005646 [Batrachochytrium salamandrivorans]
MVRQRRKPVQSKDAALSHAQDTGQREEVAVSVVGAPEISNTGSSVSNDGVAAGAASISLGRTPLHRRSARIARQSLPLPTPDPSIDPSVSDSDGGQALPQPTARKSISLARSVTETASVVIPLKESICRSTVTPSPATTHTSLSASADQETSVADSDRSAELAVAIKDNSRDGHDDSGNSDEDLVMQRFPIQRQSASIATPSHRVRRGRNSSRRMQNVDSDDENREASLTREEADEDSTRDALRELGTTPNTRNRRQQRASSARRPIARAIPVDDDSDTEFEPDAEALEEIDPEASDNIETEAGTDSESDFEAHRQVTVMISPPRARPRARQPKAKRVKVDYHPELSGIWDKLENEIDLVESVESPQPADINIKLLPFQLEGLHWMLKQEEGPFAGGILADEMGMGKTIQMISLMVARRDVGPNLIICPTVAILQWMDEIANRTTPNFFKILLFHGTNRSTSIDELLNYDIVISTYSIIESGFRKQQHGVKRKGKMVKETSLLHSIEWGRVILDEAHYIKDRSCGTARSAFALNRKRKWSLSGTPLQNRVGELYSLIRFMDIHPYSYYFCRSCDCSMTSWKFTDRIHCDKCGHTGHQHYCWWNAEILKPIQNHGAVGPGLEGFRKLRVLLDRIMLRRTKVERADELGLPPRVVYVRRDVFNAAEEELYSSLYSDSSRVFNTYAAAGTVLNNYASIFSLLSRMRLAANHPDLVTVKLAMNDKTAIERLVCGICQEEAEDAIMSKCKHVFCREDARQFVQSAPSTTPPKCPMCFQSLTIDLTQATISSSSASTGARNSIINYIDMANWRSSTKIEALVEELTSLQRDDSTAKSIVFSQFVSFLDLTQWRLTRAGFNVVRLDGRMTPHQREAVIKSFMTESHVSVFLISLKAGGVALNLTEASRVFVLDPWWNPAAEDQAFDRIHRLGQHRPIKITRIIVENSIESRILMLQEKKKALFDSTVGGNLDALAKLSEEDLQFLFVL